MGSAGTTYDRTKNDENAADDGGRREFDHSCANRSAEYIGRIISPQRPTEKQPTGEKEKYGEIHSPLFASQSECGRLVRLT